MAEQRVSRPTPVGGFHGVAPAVIAQLANRYLTDADAASLACTSATLLRTLVERYAIKQECTLEEYLHVAWPRTHPRLGRVTLGVIRRILVFDRVDVWQPELAQPNCRITHIRSVCCEFPTADVQWPLSLQSLTLRGCTELVDLSRLPKKRLAELRLLHNVKLNSNAPTLLGQFKALRALEINTPIACAYLGLHLPPELAALSFAGCTTGNLSELRLPESILKIALIGEHCFTSSLLSVKWPPHLDELSLGGSFNQPLVDLRLPASLRVLKLSDHFNQPIAGVEWPHQLRTLAIGARFDQPMEDAQFPSLTSLSLSPLESKHHQQVFQHKIRLPASLTHATLTGSRGANSAGLLGLPSGLTSLDARGVSQTSDVYRSASNLFFEPNGRHVTWPDNLTSLQLTAQYLHLGGVKLPSTLRSLEMGGEVSMGKSSGFQFPPGIQSLRLGHYDPTHGDRLPSTLTSLFIRQIYSLPSRLLPPTLLTLEFGDYFTILIRGLNLPATLTRLNLGPCFNSPLNQLRMSDGLTHLTLGPKFNQPLVGVTWSQGLLRLDLGGGDFDQPLDAARLPTSLCYLRLGSRFSHSLAAFRSLTCLALLVVPSAIASSFEGVRPIVITTEADHARREANNLLP